MFEVAEAYERHRGRSSKLLAPLFIDFVGVQGKVLDMGCGTGALTFTIAKSQAVSRIVGIDRSQGFINYARSHNEDARVMFALGDAQNLPFPDASFDRCLALLVMSFIPDPSKAVREMRRVTRTGGVVATAMWDSTGGNELNQSLWNAATALDSNAKQTTERPGSYGTAEELSSLWKSNGLVSVEVKNLLFSCGFSSFDDFWLPLIEGQGPAGAYLARLSEAHRRALRERLRQNLFENRRDGPFTLKAKAWAVRGIVPNK
jgi:ubiquinone/menaquinone biosynthesis C-methylase UbiE